MSEQQKYEAGELYMHPDLPASILMKVGQCLLFDRKDFDRLQFYTPDLKLLIRHEIPAASFEPLGEASIMATSKIRQLVFKKTPVVFYIWECVEGDEE